MVSRRRLLLTLIVVVLCLAVIRTLLELRTDSGVITGKITPPRLGHGPSAIIIPEPRPGFGLAWSKRHYPDEYQSANLSVVKLTGEDDPVNERFMDVGNLAYSREFRTGFSYSGASGAAPDVEVTYLKCGETFAGRMKARGLKPNFAYQLKVRGDFSDRAAFERIGHVGRWRLPGGRTNFTDDEYEEYDKKDLAESYLIFDFVVTDPNGNADKEFYADSSLHVLWSASYQRARDESDTVTVMAARTGGDPSVYASPKPDLSPQWVFGENEGPGRNRVPVGDAALPAGQYHAQFALTEESFHGYADEGFWATVMKGPIDFEIVDRPREVLLWKSGARRVHSYDLGAARKTGTADLVEAAAIVEAVGLSTEPLIFLDKRLCLPASGRYFLAGDILAWQSGRIEIAADAGPGFEGRRGRYSATYDAPGEWQHFEIEVTSRMAGKATRMLFDPATKRGLFCARSLGVYRISD